MDSLQSVVTLLIAGIVLFLTKKWRDAESQISSEKEKTNAIGQENARLRTETKARQESIDGNLARIRELANERDELRKQRDSLLGGDDSTKGRA